jgi:hypothetical protein
MSQLEIKWERVQGTNGPVVFRTAVPGGWLVASSVDPGAQLVYIPDPDGNWGYWEEDEGEDEEEEDEDE